MLAYGVPSSGRFDRSKYLSGIVLLVLLILLALLAVSDDTVP